MGRARSPSLGGWPGPGVQNLEGGPGQEPITRRVARAGSPKFGGWRGARSPSLGGWPGPGVHNLEGGLGRESITRKVQIPYQA